MYAIRSYYDGFRGGAIAEDRPLGRRIPPQGARQRVEPGIKQGHEAIFFKGPDQMAVQGLKQSGEIGTETFGGGHYAPFGHGHEQGRGDTVPAHVADRASHEFPLVIAPGDEIVIIAAGGFAIPAACRDVEAGQIRRPRRQQMLLDFPGDPQGFVSYNFV